MKKIINIKYSFIKHFNDLVISLLLVFIRLKKKYKILPLGTYCFSRCITTFSKIKPRKKDGEKTLPFDLAFFYNIDKIIELINNDFQDFYTNLEYDNKNNCWINKKSDAVFPHDGKLSEKEFEKLYNQRIKNLYEYINDKTSHLYIVVTAKEIITAQQIEKLNDLFKHFRNEKEFDIILINQSESPLLTNIKNVHIIEQTKNKNYFEEINADEKWVTNLARHKTKASQKIYYEIVYGILMVLVGLR